MATATGPSRTPRPRDERVYHPLDKLRGIIRRYVLIEGVLSLALFLVAWFVLALVFDFGLFKLAGWDWVPRDDSWLFRVGLFGSPTLVDGSRLIRGLALGLFLLLFLIIFVLRIVRRVTREFSYPALALVLERRFPKVLGDRLITAVELADVEKSAKFGYSAEMIRRTIDEARERVGTVPVGQVFNWRRLWLMAAMSGGVLLSVFATAVACNTISVKRETFTNDRGEQDSKTRVAVDFKPARAAWKFVNTAAGLFERDVMLRNTPWPRRTLIELQDVPPGGLRVSTGDADGGGRVATIRVRAYRWVIADRTAPEGWRRMLWTDVTPDLVGTAIPKIPFEALATSDETAAPSPDPGDWTLDAVLERGRDNAKVREKLSAAMGTDDYLALQGVFERIGKLADDHSLGRRIRYLDRPEEVAVEYNGLGPKQIAGRAVLLPGANGEYTGKTARLEEDVEFVVRAEDYRTAPDRITLVAPPALNRLTRVEYQPAYMHHAPPKGEGYPALRGLRQRMPEQKLSLPAKQASSIVVPSGTELVLTGVTENPIVKAVAIPNIGLLPGAKKGSQDPVPLIVRDVEEVADPGTDSERKVTRSTFSLELTGDFRVTSTLNFTLELTNADRLTTTREVVIQVTEDQPPRVGAEPEFFRKVVGKDGTYYWITPRARIPFNRHSSYIQDEGGGLSKIEYAVTYWPDEPDVIKAMRAGLALRSVLPQLGPGAARFPTVVQSAYHANAFRSLDRGDNRQTGSFGLARFTRLQRELEEQRLPRDEFERRLVAPSSGEKPGVIDKLELQTEYRQRIKYRENSPAVEAVKWEIDGDFFDVRALGMEVEAGNIQPRYRIDLAVKASDTNFDNGPGTGSSGTMKFLVVSAGDLLVEIGREEEGFGTKLDEALAKLAAAKKKYEFVRSKNGYAQLSELDAVKVRAKDAGQDVAKARDVVRSVVREFRRIERECVFNQLDDLTLAHYGKFANRIDRVLGENPPVASADEDEQLRDGTLRLPEAVFPGTEKLLAQVQEVLDDAENKRWADPVQVSNAEISLNTLEREVRKIRELLGEAQSRERLIKFLDSIKEAQQRIGLDIKKWQRESGGRITSKEPIINPVGAVFLTKGESKKMKHAIQWLQYEKDDLAVKVTASDPAALTVPGSLKLDFEKNQLDFEYEIRAANKEGEYTVTLTPEVGKPVVVKVTVK